MTDQTFERIRVINDFNDDDGITIDAVQLALEPIFSDAFESGSTSSWSTTAAQLPSVLFVARASATKGRVPL